MVSSAPLGLSRRLAGIDVHPASLPAAAVLLVRRLPDPAPGAWSGGDTAVGPPASWERALRTAVARTARDAARPALGPVPASAGAVVFLDPAELLACLARDFLQGDLLGRWWWQAWLRASGRSPLELIVDAWVREARHIPPALAALEQGGLAARFVAALPARAARALFVAMTDAYDLPALAAPTPAADPPAAAPPARPRREADRARAHAPPEPERARPETERAPGDPPWEPVVARHAAPATLGLEPRALVGVALLLWRAPLAARTERFRRAFHAWRRAERFARVPVGVEPASPPAAPMPRPSSADARDSARDRARAVEMPDAPRVAEAKSPVGQEVPFPTIADATRPRPPRSEDAAAAIVEAGGDDRSAASDGRTSVPPRPAPGERAAAGVRTASDPGSPGAPPATGAPGGSETVAQVHAPPASETRPPVLAPLPDRRAETVGTRLGGILFLVNALEGLEFFDRLDDHFGVSAPLGGWGWVELVARGLVGAARSDAAGDPIWDVLASLDGRAAGALPPGTCGVVRSCRLPEDWPVPERSGRPASARRRCRPLGLVPRGGLRRLLDALVPYLNWRLARAMALDAASPEDEAALVRSRLLHRDGRLTWTATHVDLHMSLEDIDIAVRLAGLDANPGWVPALGRVVTFHFERSEP